MTMAFFFSRILVHDLFFFFVFFIKCRLPCVHFKINNFSGGVCFFFFFQIWKTVKNKLLRKIKRNLQQKNEILLVELGALNH